MADVVSVKLRPELRERVKKLAASMNRSPHWIMKEAVEKYVEREETEAQFWAEVERRVKHFEETGLHVTHEEARKWLLQRAQGENVPVPKAHK